MIKLNKLVKIAKKMPLTIVTITCSLMMLGLIVNLVYYVYFKSDVVINNNYNQRQELLAQNNIRGKILASAGSVLAQTGTDETGREKRFYPYRNLFAHVVGYSAKGKMGIESSSNIQLLTSSTFVGEKIQNELAAQKNMGNTIVTTLDVSLQQAAYDALGIYKGTIIVTEPSTGKILAMVSKPDFDPNEIDKIWDTIKDDNQNAYLLNRSTQGLYPPGSTFKIITALEYFRENRETYGEYSFKCNGIFNFEDGKIQCYHKKSHGQVNLQESFEHSCNSSFANIGTQLDKKKLQNTCENLLFNKNHPVQMAYNKSKFDLPEDSKSYLVMQTSIGQGNTQITPMHLNMITSSIANNGQLMTPYLVDRIETYKGEIVKQYSQKQYKKMMSTQEADFLETLMVGVVENGTATKLKNQPYSAAGKTGSAEFGSIKGESHAWFTGYAPVENPRICVTIIVEGAGSGGDYAVPIAKRIFDTYFLK